MASRFHKLRARQQEREPLTAHGRINLVPLVDVLTSIVFFSLLTYTGAVMTNLTAFDLALPPVVVTAPGTTSGAQPDTVTLILAVGIKQGGLRVINHPKPRAEALNPPPASTRNRLRSKRTGAPV